MKIESESEELLEILRSEDFGLSQRELSRKSEYSRPTVRKYCNKLAENGMVKKIQKGNMLLYIAEKEV